MTTIPITRSKVGELDLTRVYVGNNLEVSFIRSHGLPESADPWPLVQKWVIETERGGKYRAGHYRILRDGPMRHAAVLTATSMAEEAC